MCFKKINQEELNEILRLHKMWLEGEKNGVRADLRDVNLSGADLSYSDLSGANLRNANLEYSNLNFADLKGTDLRNANLEYSNLNFADLKGTDLRNANLSFADLAGANLTGANLSFTDLKGINLAGANLTGANLTGTNLNFANLRGANLRNTKLINIKYNEYTSFFALQCPKEGNFIGYKKADNKIVKLLITKDSKRSSSTSRKCRCSKAKVLSIESIDSKENFNSVASNYDKNFIYKVGEIVEELDFDKNRWNECSTGIHFFITREEAEMY